MSQLDKNNEQRPWKAHLNIVEKPKIIDYLIIPPFNYINRLERVCKKKSLKY